MFASQCAESSGWNRCRRPSVSWSQHLEWRRHHGHSGLQLLRKRPLFCVWPQRERLRLGHHQSESLFARQFIFCVLRHGLCVYTLMCMYEALTSLMVLHYEVWYGVWHSRFFIEHYSTFLPRTDPRHWDGAGLEWRAGTRQIQLHGVDARSQGILL